MSVGYGREYRIVVLLTHHTSTSMASLVGRRGARLIQLERLGGKPRATGGEWSTAALRGDHALVDASVLVVDIVSISNRREAAGDDDGGDPEGHFPFPPIVSRRCGKHAAKY